MTTMTSTTDIEAMNDIEGTLPLHPLTDEEVRTWIQANWRHCWWGLMDCDRCPSRFKAHPCDGCSRWKDLVPSHRTAATMARNVAGYA